MNNEKMGGPAFPTMYGAEQVNEDNTLFNVTNGMTLWDYYATAALQGYLASGPSDCGFAEYASDAARQADAMLAERAKRMESER